MSDHFASLIEPVARELLGEPNKGLSSKKELRFGARGSLSVDLKKGTWFDHEAGVGGGLLDLITRLTGRKEHARFEWLDEHGYEIPPEGGGSNGAGRGKQLGPIVATYDYVDESGNFLFQVTRHDPKDFRQRKRNPITSEWEWGAKGVRQVPYRLPDLVEALASEHMVVVVEGERDVDNLRKLGIPATTNAGGAGKWRDALDQHFAGADVAIVADNDPQAKNPKTGELRFHDDGRPVLPGQDHAQDVARHLSGVAARVRVLDLVKVWPPCPPKGDISDWIAAGGTAEALYALIEPLPDWSPEVPAYDPRFRLEPFNAIKFSTAPNYLVKGVLPRVGLVVFWGPPKCGKSFWAFDLVMHVALGWEYRGRRVQQGVVVYLALEGGHGFRARVEAWRQRHLADHKSEVPFYLLAVPVDLVADHPKLIAAIQAQLGGQVPAVVVVDTLNRALIGDENKSDDMAKFIRAADMIRAVFGCLVGIVHHCGTAGSRPRGHTSLSGADDAQIAIERDEDGNIIAKVEHMKDSEAGAAIVSRLERVELGADDDGDPIASCVVVPAEATTKGPKLTGGPKLALDQLRELIAEVGERPPASNHIPQSPDILICPATLWREHFYKAYLGKPDTKQKAFVRAFVRLQELGLIGIWSDSVWLTGHAGHARTK